MERTSKALSSIKNTNVDRIAVVRTSRNNTRMMHTRCTMARLSCFHSLAGPEFAAAWIPGATPSKHRLNAHWKQTVLPVLRKSLKLHLFNELPCCLCCGDGTRLSQSARGFAKRRVAHYWLVSSRMKTDVVLLACHKPPNQPTCEDTQTDLVSGPGMRHRAACVAGFEPTKGGTDLLRNAANVAVSQREREMIHG